MKKIIIIKILLLLSACETAPVPLSPSGGNQADGTLEMNFYVGIFLKKTIDWEKTDLIAKNHCEEWGFNGAERFNDVTHECLAPGIDGSCFRNKYTYTYQCTE